jgi:hypothetical protein
MVTDLKIASVPSRGSTTDASVDRLPKKKEELDLMH